MNVTYSQDQVVDGRSMVVTPDVMLKVIKAAYPSVKYWNEVRDKIWYETLNVCLHDHGAQKVKDAITYFAARERYCPMPASFREHLGAARADKFRAFDITDKDFNENTEYVKNGHSLRARVFRVLLKHIGTDTEPDWDFVQDICEEMEFVTLADPERPRNANAREASEFLITTQHAWDKMVKARNENQQRELLRKKRKEVAV